MSNAVKNLKEMCFEEAMTELDELVQKFEDGKMTLDQAIQAYERGTELKIYCFSYLEKARNKIDMLTVAGSENGPPST
jgi:exodeoxyribonuclease VII small subunit